MSLATIELMHLNFYSRMFIWSVLVLSVFSVAVVNYSAVWVTVGAVSLFLDDDLRTSTGQGVNLKIVFLVRG